MIANGDPEDLELHIGYDVTIHVLRTYLQPMQGIWVIMGIGLHVSVRESLCFAG